MTAFNDNRANEIDMADGTDTVPQEELGLLLSAMEKQSLTKDLSIRMPTSDNDTINRIALHFNELISDFEKQSKNMDKHIETRTSQINRVMNTLASEVVDRKMTEHVQSAALHEAELANKAKSAFLANMSHELRTPLNSIIGFSEMMDQAIFGQIDNEKYQGYIKDIHFSGSHLLTLINDVLDISKIEANSMLLDESEVDVAEMIHSCTTMVHALIEGKDQNFTLQMPDDCPDLICDELRIKQVIINLLSNAIKFTPLKGDIGMHVTIEDDCAMTFKISDTGIGIAEESLEKVFEPFSQVEDIETRTIQGTGLGLALVRSLVELHGGTISIDSTPNKGTEISIYFPAERTLQI